MTSPYLEPRSSTLLLLIHQVKHFQPKDNDKHQGRDRPSPGPLGQMGAGSLEQRVIRGNAQNRLLGGNEATIRSRDELRRSADAIADEA